ncbi:hypothetical protein Hamer_G004768, partial [Homarus americanus]
SSNFFMEDYMELLHLCLIFLGGSVSNVNNFGVPGALHQTRWMAQAIFVLKKKYSEDNMVANLTRPANKKLVTQAPRCQVFQTRKYSIVRCDRFNLTLTKDELQKQYLLRIVKSHQRSFPTPSEANILQ